MHLLELAKKNYIIVETGSVIVVIVQSYEVTGLDLARGRGLPISAKVLSKMYDPGGVVCRDSCIILCVHLWLPPVEPVKIIFNCDDDARQLVRGLEVACSGLLENDGGSQRVDKGLVVFAELALHGNNRESATHITAPCTLLQEPARADDVHVYALMD